MIIKHYATRDSVKFEGPEENSGEIVTEQGGYRSTEQMVNELIDAGRRLDIARGFEVDFDDVDPDIDPTLKKSFDFMEAKNSVDYLKSVAKQRREEQQAQQAQAQQAQQTDSSKQAKIDGQTGSSDSVKKVE